jgi:predicted ABC-type ATPase
MKWEELSRAWLQAFTGWSPQRLDSYLSTEGRFDSRGRRRGRLKCGTGYACGNTCISRTKSCRVRTNSQGVERLQQLARGGGVALGGTAATATGTQLHGPADDARRLLQKREALFAQAQALVNRKAADGVPMMDRPTPAVLRTLEALGKRIAAVDSQLQVIDGKSPKDRRWRKGTPGLLNTFEGVMGPPYPDTPGRVAYREQLIQDALAKGSKQGKGEGGRPLAIVMMGGPGSGKSTMMKKDYPDRSGFVEVDPDGMKERLPEYLLAVANSDKLAAARSHEESSTAITDRLKKLAIEGRYNVVLDGTGKNANKYEAMMRDLKAKGYEVRLMMPHIPLEVGVKRVRDRAHRNGRFVPTPVVEEAYASIPGNFERLAKIADYAVLRDGTTTDQAGNLTMESIMEYRGGRIVGEEGAKAASFRRQYGGTQ